VLERDAAEPAAFLSFLFLKQADTRFLEVDREDIDFENTRFREVKAE
jgi:hypothetical protein